ncbi:MAG: hypothetical protein A3G24_27015 [Betaproteobacteria bacterium RIFCSPLOWO2_12_FULL_62_13]|nr:MAG: hypothetical protein A3G24_27015 [Betaproteobacteria bacterium RIFCSPLOWO2_12_FULL_62_13]
MVIDMNETRLCSLEQLRDFLDATAEVQFLPAEGEDARYAHLEAVLERFGYRRLGRKHKGLVLRYLVRTTGYSRQQVRQARCPAATHRTDAEARRTSRESRSVSTRGGASVQLAAVTYAAGAA